MPDFTAPGPDAGLSSLANGLNSLAGGLFPDPSKVAQAGYYGAETYRARTQAQILQDQLAAQAALPGQINRTFGASEAAPPQAPPVAPTPTPQSHGLATWFTNLFTPGGDASNAAGTTAPQPPVASPAPDAGAPPGPNITGTNGKPIPQDDAAGPIHPASVLPPGNAQIQGGPAAANGSPATLALAQLYAVALRANGNNAEAAKGQLAAGITSMMAHNMLTHDQARDALAGLGINGMYESDQANVRSFHADQTRITTEGMSQAGQTQREGMSEGAAQRRQDTTPYAVAGPDGTSGVVATQGTAPGHPVYDQELNRTLKTPGTFIGPDQQPVTSTPGQAVTPGSGLHKPSTAEDTLYGTQNTPENFTDNRTGATVFISPKVAAAAPPGTYTKQTLAQTHPVTVMGPAGGPAAQVPASVAQARGLPLQPSAPPEDLKNSFPLIKGALLEDLARRYALQSAHTMSNNTEDATLPPALMAEAQRRVAAYKQWGPPMPDGAIAPQVISDMQQDGLIPKENTPPEQGGLDRGIKATGTAGRFVTENKIDKAGNPTTETVRRILIPALTPTTPPTSWSGRALRGELSGAATGQAATGQMPAGAVDVAPAGMVEGQKVGTQPGVTTGVVHGGFIYPITQGGNG